MEVKETLKTALLYLANFTDDEDLEAEGVRDSIFLPGGPHCSSAFDVALPEGLTWQDFETIGAWRRALRARLADEYDSRALSSLSEARQYPLLSTERALLLRSAYVFREKADKQRTALCRTHIGDEDE